MHTRAVNAQILGVSVDSQFSHLAWIQTGTTRQFHGMFILAVLALPCRACTLLHRTAH